MTAKNVREQINQIVAQLPESGYVVRSDNHVLCRHHRSDERGWFPVISGPDSVATEGYDPWGMSSIDFIAMIAQMQCGAYPPDADRGEWSFVSELPPSIDPDRHTVCRRATDCVLSREVE